MSNRTPSQRAAPDRSAALEQQLQAGPGRSDYQVTTDQHASRTLPSTVRGVLADYLASGIDPHRSTIFTHSAVPALNELVFVLDAGNKRARQLADNTLTKVHDRLGMTYANRQEPPSSPYAGSSRRRATTPMVTKRPQRATDC